MWYTVKCHDSSSILKLYNLSHDQELTKDDVFMLSPAVLYQSYTCNLKTEEEVPQAKIAEAWAYGFLSVTIINICALVGVVVLPIMNRKIYKKVLLFLVALAVGSMAGSGLLVLIPEGFELVGNPERKHDHLWMGTTMMGGIYLFFLIERLLKIILQWRQKDKSENRKSSGEQNLSDIVCSIKAKTPVDMDTAKMKDPATYHASATQCTSSQFCQSDSEESLNVNKIQTINNHSNTEDVKVNDSNISTTESTKKSIKTVAWMIIFGDGLHNFIDGLSIGAAFTSSVITGVSVSVAVICEELPHELGDFAILLNAGMNLKKALLFNFLSACMCYLGLILGILVGEATSGHRWIFGLAGGMFLYISLVDMVPEMNSVVEANENQDLGTLPMFLLQNLGMLTGFSIILIISYYDVSIEFNS